MTTWRPGMPILVKTENYTLRALKEADATPTYVAWWNDAEVQAGLGFKPRGWTIQHAVQHIRKFAQSKNYHLGIFPKGENLPIGFFTILSEADGRAMTNTIIGNKDYWGKGVVLEVREAMLDFLFFEAGIFKVVGSVDGRNLPMIFNYKKQGFTCEGILRQHKIGIDGTRHDLLQFGLLADEWKAARGKVD